MPVTFDQRSETDAARAAQMFAAGLPSSTAELTFRKRLRKVCAHFACTPAGLTVEDLEVWYLRNGGDASPAAKATRAQLRRFLACGVRWGLL